MISSRNDAQNEPLSIKNRSPKSCGQSMLFVHAAANKIIEKTIEKKIYKMHQWFHRKISVVTFNKSANAFNFCSVASVAKKKNRKIVCDELRKKNVVRCLLISQRKSENTENYEVSMRLSCQTVMYKC